MARTAGPGNSFTPKTGANGGFSRDGHTEKLTHPFGKWEIVALVALVAFLVWKCAR